MGSFMPQEMYRLIESVTPNNLTRAFISNTKYQFSTATFSANSAVSAYSFSGKNGGNSGGIRLTGCIAIKTVENQKMNLQFVYCVSIM